MPGQRSHALRRGRWSQPGGIYLLTFVTAGREPWFTDWDAASRVSRVLASADAWGDCSLLCWVLMPDHWHGLVQLCERQPLSRAVGRARALATRAWKPPGDRPLWQRSFHDHALRAEEDLVDVARYIVANPLRAGLVRRYGDYPYWDAVWISPDASPDM